MSTDHKEITEVYVLAWLTERAKEVQAEFGGYAAVTADLMLYATGETVAKFVVGSGSLSANYSGDTIEKALELARGESPAKIAAQKRERAARLLAEADKLEGKA